MAVRAQQRQVGQLGLGSEYAEEVWVSSPEPAVGVFTTAGTCQGRLRRYCVIGSPTLDRTRLPSGPAAIGFGGGAGTGQGAANRRKQVGRRCRGPGRHAVVSRSADRTQNPRDIRGMILLSRHPRVPTTQVAAPRGREPQMLLKTIGSRPSRAGMPADLANGFANNSRERQRMQLDSRDERDPYEQARPTTADWSGRPGSCYGSAGPYRASCRSSVGVTSLRWAVRLRVVRSSV